MPDAIKARQISGNNFISLIDEAVATTESRKEMRQLVRTEAGWKIFSVVYTVRDELSAKN